VSDELDGLLALLADDPADELSSLLVEIRWLMLRYPLAARAAYRALVAEGRRVAATEEGAQWRRRLEGSELLRRGQLIWEAGTLNLLESGDDGVLPSDLIDAFCRAATRRDLEPALARALEPMEDKS
jgi:hypothetical protein